jgi:2,3-bisphosphoglycerate-dependent phosphoglycerate mutase
MKTKIHITFMRHGRSRADDENVHEGRYDSPLTEIGRAQIRQRATGWQSQGITFDRIIASTLQRAAESAQIVGDILQIPVERDPDWMEMNNGPLAGLSREVAAQRYPQPAFRNPYEPFWETGESDWELYGRAARAVEKVIRRGAGRYLVVAHGGILNDALRTIVGSGPTVNASGIWFRFGDAGYARTVYNPQKHQWGLLELKSE